MKTRTWVVVGLVVLGLVGAGGWFAMQAMNKSKKGNKSDPKDVALVFAPKEVTQPALAPMPVTLALSGPLVAPQSATVRAKASGALLSLAVSEGDRVKAGQTLGRVDNSDIDSRLAERSAMLESMRVQAAQSQRTHESNVKLAQEQFISSNALEASRVALDAARANVRATEAQLGSVRAAAKLANLVAPIDGVVAKRHVVPGEKITPEQALITVVDVRKLELVANVGTHEVSLLKPGMTLQVSVEGATTPMAGPLLRIAPAAEAGTRSIGVVVGLDNANEQFRAGQYAIARVVLPGGAPRLTVPATSIVSVGGQDYAWVLADGVLARRAVGTGLKDAVNGRVEVLQGLTANDRVLSMKFDNLREGQKASVSTPASAPMSVPKS
jgi:membrane fusion protein, multidrug efflux system